MSEPIQSIAQNNYILATQQEVSHDNSLSGNGTVNSPLGVVPGYNETVLWEGKFTTAASGMPLSEKADNFSKLKFVHYWVGNGTWAEYNETIVPITSNKITLSHITQIASAGAASNVYYTTNTIAFESTANNKFVHIGGYRANMAGSNTSTGDITVITQIIGINRIANN